MDDLGKLVCETFKVQTKLHGSNPFDSISVGENQNDPTIPRMQGVPGLIYMIDRTHNTFRIHTLPSKNLSTDFQKVRLGEFEDHIPLGDGTSTARPQVFETEYYEVAEVISELVGNRRFPLHEENFYNIGDPGHSWWLKTTDEEFSIFFKRSHTEDEDIFFKLGPIGDPSIAGIRFRQAQQFFEQFFDIKQFESNENKMRIALNSESPLVIKNFKSLFLFGDMKKYHDLVEQVGGLPPTLDYFFRELIWCRRFWVQVERSLTLKLN
jgi:hypothetical protein